MSLAAIDFRSSVVRLANIGTRSRILSALVFAVRTFHLDRSGLARADAQPRQGAERLDRIIHSEPSQRGQLFYEERYIEFRIGSSNRLYDHSRARRSDMRPQFRAAISRISLPVDGEVLASSWIVTVTPCMPEGELRLIIFDFAIALLGTIARSRCPVSTCVARQFISMTLPSVPSSRLIQSPGT